jgi:AcrR family transcriptional regulator
MLYNRCYITIVIFKEGDMAPKIKFRKETVAGAAFNIVRRTGWESLTARAVAAELKSSTMPIYRYMKSMDVIAGEVRNKTLALLVEYQTKKYTSNPFMNLAIGYVNFAAREKKLFLFYFLEITEKTSWPAQQNIQLAALKRAGIADEPPEESGLNKREWEGVGRRTWIFTHGLAALAAGRVMDGMDEKEIERLLFENGKAVINDVIASKKGGKR